MFEEWRVPEGTLSGHHSAVGTIALADCVIVQELGSDAGLKSNVDIVDHLFAEEQEGLLSLPMFVSNSLAQVVRDRADELHKTVNIVHVFEGESAAGLSENLGTYGELSQFIENNDVEHQGPFLHPAFITSAYNIGNILRQANLLGIDGFAPDNLPRTRFDWHSKQLWTKNLVLWALTSPIRIRQLRKEQH
jgi:hypothetical protein